MFTKSEKSWVWKRPLQVALSNLLAWGVWMTAGWSGPCPDKFLIYSETALHTLSGQVASVFHQTQSKKFFKKIMCSQSPQPVPHSLLSALLLLWLSGSVHLDGVTLCPLLTKGWQPMSSGLGVPPRAQPEPQPANWAARGVLLNTSSAFFAAPSTYSCTLIKSTSLTIFNASLHPPPSLSLPHSRLYIGLRELRVQKSSLTNKHWEVGQNSLSFPVPCITTQPSLTW